MAHGVEPLTSESRAVPVETKQMPYEILCEQCVHLTTKCRLVEHPAAALTLRCTALRERQESFRRLSKHCKFSIRAECLFPRSE